MVMSTHLDRSKSMSEKPKKKWMKQAFSGAHGQFKAKAEAAGKSTKEFAKEHEHDEGKTGKQARLAEVGMKAKHKSPSHLMGKLYGKKKG